MLHPRLDELTLAGASDTLAVGQPSGAVGFAASPPVCESELALAVARDDGSAGPAEDATNGAQRDDGEEASAGGSNAAGIEPSGMSSSLSPSASASEMNTSTCIATMGGLRGRGSLEGRVGRVRERGQAKATTARREVARGASEGRRRVS